MRSAVGIPCLSGKGGCQEKNWLRSWTNDFYLWFSEVPDKDPAGYASDATYFAALKTSASTASGKLKDRFHFTYPTADWEALSQLGVQAGYGANFVIIAATPPRDVVVAYTDSGSAAAIAPASIARGAHILAVDGVDLVNANDQASIDTLNAGLQVGPVQQQESNGQPGNADRHHTVWLSYDDPRIYPACRSSASLIEPVAGFRADQRGHLFRQ
jgi:Peptidase S41 N-terminal domain